MARPLRIEFPGALYHVTSRGDRGEPIFADNDDRYRFLEVLAEAVSRFDAAILAYCLMGNHYHMVVRTDQGNLSKFMRQLNGVYSQAFNRRHQVVGHVFQGRFHAVVVDKDAYFAVVCRYVELNPIRARLVQLPAEWMWSSYRAHVGLEAVPSWLDTVTLQGYVLGRDIGSDDDTRRAQELYAAFVSAGRDDRLWARALRQEIYLGEQAFIERVQAQIAQDRVLAPEIPRTQRKKPKSLAQWAADVDASREEILRRAHELGGLTMAEMAEELNITVARVSQLVRRAECQRAASRAEGDTAYPVEDDPDRVGGRG